MTLRRILALSILAACGLPLLVFWLWPHSRALEAELERVHERHLVLAQAAASTLDVYQTNVTATFSSVADGLIAGEYLGYAYDLLAAQSFSHFCVVDAKTGRVISALQVVDRKLPETLPPDLMTELKRHMAGDVAPLSEIWRSSKGVPQLLLVQDYGEVFVFASLSPAFIQQISEAVIFGERGHMAVIDARGRLIAHPNPEWANQAKDLTSIPEIEALFQSNEPQVVDFYALAISEDVTAGVATIADTGWRVLVPQPVSEVRSTVREGRISATLVLMLGLVLTALLALVISAIILSPLKRLTRAADAMANGTDGVVVGTFRFAPLEMRILANSFNKMARRTEATLQRVSNIARQDAATGLLNKRSFYEAADQRLKEIGDGVEGILLHVDLNNLKRINDTYGHAVGDAAITRIGGCLKHLFPTPSLIGRVGGDEFLVLTELDQTKEHLMTRIDPLLRGEAVDVGNGLNAQTKVVCSIGAASVADSLGDLALLMLHADEAMYYAKRSGCGFKLHDAAMKVKSKRRTELAARLRRDVATDKIDAAFQPIQCAQLGKIMSFETLARWSTKDFGPVQPCEFLEIAQDIGILSDLDGCVRRKAFAFIRDLRGQGLDLPAAVNVTADDLARADFLSRFLGDLTQAGLSGKDVIVEVTEAIFHDRYGLAMRSLAELASHGVKIHLDDFGKGFSAHGLLPMCSFEAVKVDMRFYGSPTEDPKSAAIIGSLASLGTQLGLTVTLEGIETEAEERFALQKGANRVQGYLYARPLPKDLAIEAARASQFVSAAE